ncbi:hypothetical protein STEG23_008077, partial [Scotinomys teguina]
MPEDAHEFKVSLDYTVSLRNTLLAFSSSSAEIHLDEDTEAFSLRKQDQLRSYRGVGGVQVLAMDKSAGTEIDFKYAIIGTALGVAISAGFLALKIWMIRRHLSDNDSADLKNTPQ